MHRQLERDPTEFFSVVGAPYVRERVGESHTGPNFFRERVARAPRSRGFKIGLTTVGAGMGAVALGISLFATSGAARLGEAAYQAIAAK